MSRCFPFPPPGYEKSARIGENNEDLLKKHKEKKHKKDKRDKEKGEKKERKNKDGSKDKRKEKRDRKEKHKDKTKDKDKIRIPENTRTETQPELHHEDQFGYNNHKVEKVEDFKFREELGRRIRDEEREGANQMAGNFANTTQRRLEGMGTSTAMEKGSDRGNKMVFDLIGTAQRRNENLTPSIQTKNDGMGTTSVGAKQQALHQGANIEKLSSIITAGSGKNHVKVRSVDDFKGPFQNRAASRNHVTGRPVENFTCPFKSRAEGMFTSNSVQNADNLMGSDHKTEGTVTGNSIQKERPGSNNGTGRPVGNAVGSIGRSSFAANTMPKERSSDNNMVPDFVGLGQQQTTQKIAEGSNTAFLENKTVERTDAGLEKATNKKKERKEKRKEKKTEDGKREERKDRDGNEKKSRRKDKDRHKEKEKEEKISKSFIPCVDNTSARAPAPEVNNKKRKDHEINGFLHKVDERPNKLPRTSASSSHTPLENGKTLESSHIPSTCCSPPIKLDATNNTKKVMVLDNKETMVNGKVEAHPSSVVLRPPVIVGSGGSGKIPSRSSHPDEKYLGTVCRVPKTAEWPESDCQEWLFSSKKPQTSAKLETDELPEIWAEGLQIESADVFALPYVIPF